jgi:hypothetical protein
MDFKDILKKLVSLDLPTGTFAIFGSGPMAVRGLKQPNDLDVIVTKETYDAYKNKDGWVEKSFNNGEKYYLEKDGIELWNDWGPGTWDLTQLIKTAETIDGLPYVTLDQVLLWKKINGRPKDLDDIKKIEMFLGKSL